MELKKTGELLKRLRKEKGLTQEQLAERFHVSARTVSRWETGSNMPDLDALVELSDFYGVDIRERIDGERKSEIMEDETKDTLKKVAEYATEENKRLKTKLAGMLIGSAVLIVFCWVLLATRGFAGRIAEGASRNFMAFSLGLTTATLVINALHLFGVFDKIRARKCK